MSPFRTVCVLQNNMFQHSYQRQLKHRTMTPTICRTAVYADLKSAILKTCLVRNDNLVDQVLLRVQCNISDLHVEHKLAFQVRYGHWWIITFCLNFCSRRLAACRKRLLTEKKYLQNTEVIMLLAEESLRPIVETGTITCYSDLQWILDDIAAQVKRSKNWLIGLSHECL